MKVSVIIPVYNVERYLVRCLDSVLAAVARLQENPAGHTAEIICVNDGSTDGSAAILERYRSTFGIQPSTFTVITKENGGQGSARNAALDKARGDYVMFVDSDDWIPPHAVLRFLEVAEASEASLVVSMAFARERLEVSPPESPAWRLRPAAWMAGKKVQYSVCNRLIRADLVRERRFLPVKFEDFAYATELMCDVGTFAAIDEPLYVYCSNGVTASTTRSPFSREKIGNSFAVLRHLLDHARGRPSYAFAMRQAADGLSSTVGKAYKTRDLELYAPLLTAFSELVADYPSVCRHLKLKARVRLWVMRAKYKMAKCGIIPTTGSFGHP